MTPLTEPEKTVQRMHERTAAALAAVPYFHHLGIRLAADAHDGEVTFYLPFDARLVGNPSLPAIHFPGSRSPKTMESNWRPSGVSTEMTPPAR